MADSDDDSTFGQFIRHQREMQDLTMRQLADLVGISNPYLSTPVILAAVIPVALEKALQQSTMA